MEFSINKMKEVFKQVGDKRVSEDSAKALNDILEDVGGEISDRAIEIAEENGRKTVRAEDVREALSEFKTRETNTETSLEVN